MSKSDLNSPNLYHNRFAKRDQAVDAWLRDDTCPELYDLKVMITQLREMYTFDGSNVALCVARGKDLVSAFKLTSACYQDLKGIWGDSIVEAPVITNLAHIIEDAYFELRNDLAEILAWQFRQFNQNKAKDDKQAKLSEAEMRLLDIIFDYGLATYVTGNDLPEGLKDLLQEGTFLSLAANMLSIPRYLELTPAREVLRYFPHPEEV